MVKLWILIQKKYHFYTYVYEFQYYSSILNFVNIFSAFVQMCNYFFNMFVEVV